LRWQVDSGVVVFEDSSRIRRTGYVDIDQLGMCRPAVDDQSYDCIKARNIGQVLRNFADAGAEQVVVSGILDPGALALYLEECGDILITFCRLTATVDTLAARNVARGRSPEQVAQVLRHAEAMERSDYAHVRIDTDGRDVVDTARLVQEAVAQIHPSAPGEPPYQRLPAAGPTETLDVLLLCGAQATGKSSVGFALFLELGNTGTPVAYLDLQQIGFLSPPPVDDAENRRLKAANLSAMLVTFAEVGMRQVIASGPVSTGDEVQRYRSAVAPATLTVCRLHADLDALQARFDERAQGKGPPLAGDDLVHRSQQARQGALARAMADAKRLSAQPVEDFWIDTTGRTLSECVDQVQEQLRLQDASKQ